MKKSISVFMICCFLFLACSCEKTSKNISNNAAATTQNNNYKTFTGLKPLDEITYKVNDPKNTKGISEEKIAHAYGVAKNETPHKISVESQIFFEKNGYKAVTFDSKNESKVLYLTFDCGYENGYTAQILDVLKQKNVKAAFFCTLDNIKAEPELIARIIKDGHIVGNHSSKHPSFAEIDRKRMAHEIEECENYLRKNFGYSSKFFRFPKGEYSESALDLIGSLGFVSVFWSLAYDDWNTNKQRGSDYAFEKVTSRLHPGAVILLHSVSADNAGAIERIIDFAREQGYSFNSLENITLSYSK